MHDSATHDERITVRLAGTCDADALDALAQLDSAAVPAAPVLLAEVDGRARAALSLTDGASVADPFERTEHLVVLLRVHASLLAEESRSRSAARAIRHAARALSPRALPRAT
jgi:hypothetical protein